MPSSSACAPAAWAPICTSPAPSRSAKLQKVAVEESRLGIPLLFAMDVVHGYRTIFPVPLAMAATWAPEVAGARRAHCRRRGHVGGPALDLRAHGRHRARSALGPHRRRRGRGSVSRRAHGRGAGGGLPGRQRAAAGFAHGHRQAFRRLWRRHRWPRLQQRGHLRAHAAGGLSTAVLRRGARRLRLVHGRRSTTSPACRPPRTANCCAALLRERWGWQGLMVVGLGLDRRAAQSRRRGGSRRRRRAGARRVAWTWTWSAACSPTT